MKKYKKLIIFIFSIAFIHLIWVSAFAEDNAGSGDGSTGGAVEGKGFYRSGEWMYKVSIYVGNKDTAETNSSFYYNYVNIGGPVFVKPSSYRMPNGTIFAKSNKVNYLRGAQIESDSNPIIITENSPPIPITHV